VKPSSRRKRPGRPERDHLLASLRPGDTVYIYQLDRLGHSRKHLLDRVAGPEFRGVGLVSLTDALNTTSAQARPRRGREAAGGGFPKKPSARPSWPGHATASSNSA